jgi:hypothetical protein
MSTLTIPLPTPEAPLEDSLYRLEAPLKDYFADALADPECPPEVRELAARYSDVLAH